MLNQQEQKNLNVLNHQLVTLDQKLKDMTKGELINQIENLEYMNEQAKQEMEHLQKDLEYYKNQLEISKQSQDEIRKKMGQLNIQVKNQNKEIQALKKENEIDKQKIKKFITSQEKIRQVLESQNKENYSGLKQIKSLYSQDQAISQIIDDSIRKQLAKFNSQEKSLKQELKIHSIFCREYIKMILYMKNVHRQSQELKRLQQSLNLSHMVKESELNRVSELFNHSQVSEKKPNLLVGIEEKMEELKAFFEVGQNNQQNEEIEDLLNQIQELKGEKNSLNEQVFIITERLYDMQSLNQKYIEELRQNFNQLQKLNMLQSTVTYNQDDELEFDYKNFDQKKYNARYNEQIERLRKQVQNESEDLSSKPEAIQKIHQLETSLNKSNKENRQLQKDIEKMKESLYESLQKQKYLEENNMIPIEEENTEDQYLNHAIISNYKEEIKSKNEIIINISEVNGNLFKRLENLQSERLEILREKQHCEDLFVYFKERSNKIYLMNNNINKVIQTNENLKNMILKFIKIFEVQNKTFGSQYNKKEQLLQQVLEEFKQSLYLAQYHYDTFKTDKFDEYLNLEQKKQQKQIEKSNNEPEIIIKKPIEDQQENQNEEKDQNNKIESGKGEQQSEQQSVNQSEVYDIKMNQFDRENYAKTITKLNRVMMENEQMKHRIEIQDKKLLDLQKDIVLFQKKAKMFAEIEGKIDLMVGENIQLKSILENFQKMANDNSKEVQDDVKGFSNFVDMQYDVLDKTKTYVYNIKKEKKAAEKNAFTLQRKLDEKEKQYLDNKNDLRLKEAELALEVKEKNKKSDQLKQLNKEKNNLEKNYMQTKEELDKSKKQIESLNQTIVLLEKNLYNLTSNKTDDMQNLKQEIEQQKETILQKQMEEKSKIQKFTQLEKSNQNLQKQLSERENVIKEHKQDIENKQVLNTQLQNDIKHLKEDIEEYKQQLIKKEIEKDALKYERETISQKNELLKNDLSNTIQENKNILQNEKKKVYEQVKQQWQDKIKQYEDDIQKYKNLYTESQYEKGKIEREQEDIDIKLQLRNKQLIHFYSYFLKNDVKENSSNELQTFIVQNKELLRDIELLRVQNQQLQKLYDDLQQNIDKQIIENPKAKLQRIDDQIQDMKSSMIDEQFILQQGDKYQMQALIDMYEEKNKYLQKNIESSNQKNTSLESWIKKVEQEKNLKEEQNQEMLIELQAIRKNYQESKEDLNEEKKLNEQLKTNNQNLQQELKNVKMFGQEYDGDQMQEISRLRQLNLDYQKQINNLELRVREKNKEINQLSESMIDQQVDDPYEEISVLKKLITKLEKEKNIQNQELADLKSEYIILENKLEDYQKNNSEVEKLNQKMREESMKRQMSEKNLNELKGLTNELQENHIDSISEIQQLKNKNQDLEGENEDLIDEIEITKKNITKLNEKIKILTKEKILLATHINNLKKDSEKLKKENQINNDLIFELENEIKSNTDEATKKYLDKLKNDLQNAENSLNSAKEHQNVLIKKSNEISEMKDKQIQKLEIEIDQLRKEIKEQKENDYL